jgi:hypothetical protein
MMDYAEGDVTPSVAGLFFGGHVKVGVGATSSVRWATGASYHWLCSYPSVNTVHERKVILHFV